MTAKAIDQPVPIVPLFKPFSWHHDPSRCTGSDLETATRDIARGIHLILEILERSQLDEDYGDPVVGRNDQGTLIRFAISSARLLFESADSVIEWRNDQYDAEQKPKKGEDGK